MKVIIGEDDILIAEHLRDILESFNIVVSGVGHKKEDIIRLVDKKKPDLALLDIRMKGAYDGIEIGEYIMLNYNFPIIYITAHSDREIVKKALHTKPSGYIIKPFKSMDVFTAIQIAMDKFSSNKPENFILVKDAYKTVKIYLFEIAFLKADNNYVEINTKKGKYLERSSLENLLKTIDSEDFLQVHRSYAINLNYAVSYKAHKVQIGEIQIPVSRKFVKSLKQRLFFSNPK